MAGIGRVMGKKPMQDEEIPQDEPTTDAGADQAAPEDEAAPPSEEEAVPSQEVPPEGGTQAPSRGVGAAMQGGGQAAPEGEPEGNVTPEEQAEYEQIMGNALKVIYPEGGDDPSPNVLQALKGSENPVVNLANAAVIIVRGLRDSAEKGGEVKRWNEIAAQGDLADFDGILFHVGSDVTNELAELSEAAKIHDYSEEEAENAFYIALDMYREQAKEAGQIDEEGLKQGWAEVSKANEEGRLGELLPGVEERMNKAGASAPNGG